MSDKDFVVKNGLQVNNGVWVVNTAGIYYNSALLANSTFFAQEANTALNANNSDNLGGVTSSDYMRLSTNQTVTGNINFTGANVQFADQAFFGGQTVVANSSGFYVEGTVVGSSGGYYKGNDGVVGEEANKANLYKINANTQTANITILAGENAITVGPIKVDTGYNLTVETGGRVVVV